MNPDSAVPTLPPNLLQAISSPSGGRVVLVLGAGCSKEEPTNLPLASELSAECCRRLVADGILSMGEVGDQNDLSAVADAVFLKEGSQRKLIELFPKDAFRHAKPNEGHLIMVALLLEGALSDILTLNFDHAARAAMADLGAGMEISEIRGPDDHTLISTRNFIYLHGDIDSPADEIILRTEALDRAWRGGWGEVVTQRVLSGPVTVFVGLGTPVSVLVETAGRILKAIGNSGVQPYVVDPSAYEDSKFASALQISSQDYFRMGWNTFMRALAQRVVEEHRASLERACGKLAEELDQQGEDVSGLCRKLAGIGLVRLGKLRAAWMLDKGSYLPHDPGIPLRLFGTLVLGIRIVERVSGHQAGFADDWLVEFSQERQVTRVMVCTGDSVMTVARIEVELRKRQHILRERGQATSIALVGGIESGTNVETPNDIVANPDPDDLLTGPGHLRILSLDELRADPELAHEVVR